MKPEAVEQVPVPRPAEGEAWPLVGASIPQPSGEVP